MVDRIREAFLDDASLADEMISQNLKQPRRSPLRRIKRCIVPSIVWKATREVEDTDDVVENIIDFKDVDNGPPFKNASLEHYASMSVITSGNEWWKSLEILP